MLDGDCKRYFVTPLVTFYTVLAARLGQTIRLPLTLNRVAFALHVRPIFRRRGSMERLEARHQVALVGKAAFPRDAEDGEVCGCQKLARLFEAFVQDIAVQPRRRPHRQAQGGKEGSGISDLLSAHDRSSGNRVPVAARQVWLMLVGARAQRMRGKKNLIRFAAFVTVGRSGAPTLGHVWARSAQD